MAGGTESLFSARWWQRHPVSWHYAPGLFWIRIFGRGVHVRDTARHPLRFSERNGHGTFWTIRRLR